MEKFSPEQFKPEAEGEELGIERVKDVGKAYLMASMENLAYEQARAYEHYLDKPEPHTVGENAEFIIWKRLNYSPADIKIIGQEDAEITGRKYDVEKDVQKYETKKNRIGLAKEEIKAVFNIAYSHIKFAIKWAPSTLFGFAEPKDSKNEVIKDFRHFFQNFSLESHRFLAAREAIQKLGKNGRKEYTAEMLDEEAKKALLNAEKYKLPNIAETKIDPNKKRKEKTEDKKQGQSDKEPQKEGVVADTFEWICKKYGEYLSLSDERKQDQSFFRNLEDQGVTLEDLREQEKAVTEWLNRLKIYGKRLENLTDDELRKEMKFSFLTSVTKQILESREEKSGSEILLDIGASLFKTYQASKELGKREMQKEKAE